MTSQTAAAGNRPSDTLAPESPVAVGLDPQDWDAYRAEAHRLLDQALSLVESVRERPVWQPMPPLVRQALAEPLPVEPQGLDKTAADAERLILPYPTGNTHPRFFGWVHGSGTAGGIVAEMLAAAMNSNAGGRDHGAIHVERQVIDWCRSLFGFPQGASGLLVSGTSMATLIALTVARNQALGPLARANGLAAANAPLVAYTSGEAHSSVARAFEMLGLGSSALRAIPTDGEFRLDVQSLRDAIEADRRMGNRPFAVIATAGTVNTGAIDPLAAIADICAEEQIWLHVDGAFGALIALSDTLRPRLTGIERADSLAFDFHKWLHVPYDAGCVLVRDGAAHRAAFASRPTYLAGHARGLAAGEPWPCDFGPELSRGFRALKVWFALKEHGTARFAASIEDNCRLARGLGERISATPGFELMAPVTLNIACFRLRADALGPEQQDKLNETIVAELQERGIAAPSTTRIQGRLAIRVNITNHRTRDADLEVLMDALKRIGNVLLSAQQPLPVAEEAAGTIPFACLAVLDEALARPEIAGISSGLNIAVEAVSGAALKVTARGQLRMRPCALIDSVAAAVLIRHGHELSTRTEAADWQSGIVPAAVSALLAARTAACHLALLPAAERTAAQAALPKILSAAYDVLCRPLAAADLAQIATQGGAMLALLLDLAGAPDSVQSRIAQDMALRIDVLNEFAKLMTLAPPAEHLLTHGGDARIKIDAKSGRNSYGSSARPTSGEIGFSSSTATCVSPEAYASVEALRHRLISGRTTFAAEIERMRNEIALRSGASECAGAQIVLTASGTDAELATLALSLALDSRPVTSIVVSPDETGSGVPQATLGRHFSTETALGAAVKPGTAIEGLAEARVCSVSVPIRNADGSARPSAVIRDDVAAACERAAASGHRILLHVLDAAKTGIGAPALDDVAALARRYGEAMDVVVDACQARLGPEAVAAYLEQGWLVQMTGSKFWGGPPFSGALLVPSRYLNRSAGLKPLLAALGSYMSRHEWPAVFGEAREALPAAQNLGLLSRWQAALAEAERFAAIAPAEATQFTRVYMATVKAALADYPEMLAVDGLPIDHGPICANDSWRDLRSIVPIIPTRGGASLSLDDVKLLHQSLARDVSAKLASSSLDAAERRLAATPCHLGQPVKLGATGALRICASVRTLAKMAQPGGTEQLRHDLGTVLAKARVLIANLDGLKVS